MTELVDDLYDDIDVLKGRLEAEVRAHKLTHDKLATERRLIVQHLRNNPDVDAVTHAAAIEKAIHRDRAAT